MKCNGIIIGKIRMEIIFENEFIVLGKKGRKVLNRMIKRIELREVKRIGRLKRDNEWWKIGDGEIGKFIEKR